MQPNLKASLVKYQYDALNRLVASTPSTQDATQRFYLKDHLITEIQGKVQRSIMQHEDQLLAQQQRQGSKAMQTALFATDPSRSVLCLLDAIQAHAFAYPPYGHSPLGNGLLSLLGFTGERLDPVTGCYLLGNGYRAFNPVLTRFNSPDSWSPFGKGGMNSYAYCGGDPVNKSDQTGHMFNPKIPFNSLQRSPPRVNRAIKHVPKSGPLKNIIRISDELTIYDDTFKNQPRLNIDAHGIDTPIFKSTRVFHDGELLDAKGLFSLIKKQVDPEKYGSIRLLICNSANGGSNSLAAGISKLSKKPTKGFLGQVIIENKLELLTEEGLIEQKRIRAQGNNQMPPIVDTLIDKSRNYQPRTFN